MYHKLLSNSYSQAGALANPEHLAKLKEGVESWNLWRKGNLGIRPDFKEMHSHGADLKEANLSQANLWKANLGWAELSGADLSGSNLCYADLGTASLNGANLGGAHLSSARLAGANFRGADLSGADLSSADIYEADLAGADLRGARLGRAMLIGANLTRADIRGAHLFAASLVRANLTRADLSGANLREVTMVDTNLEGANLTACSVYGISAWNVNLEGAIQSNLVITPSGESAIQVDNLEVAQFVYLLLNNKKIRSVIDTITSKVVLILGRFTPDRKIVLEAIRDELRKRDYLPVLFDFEKPTSQTTVETISTLAHMARFVIADLTDAKSVLQELQTVVPLSPSVVVQPLLLASQEEPGMFDFILKFPWVLDTHRYMDQTTLLREFKEEVIDPAEAKAKELARK
jgi:uncharacterized protein YjbI with pentapeptide repeats